MQYPKVKNFNHGKMKERAAKATRSLYGYGTDDYSAARAASTSSVVSMFV